MSDRLTRTLKFKREYELELAGLRLESDTLYERLDAISARVNEVKDMLKMLADIEAHERKRMAKNERESIV